MIRVFLYMKALSIMVMGERFDPASSHVKVDKQAAKQPVQIALKHRIIALSENQTLMLKCEDNDVINITKANYGRFSLYVFNPKGLTEVNGTEKHCTNHNAKNIIGNKCDGFKQCMVLINNKIFAVKCPMTPKYAEVHYLCGNLTGGLNTTADMTTTQSSDVFSTSSPQLKENSSTSPSLRVNSTFSTNRKENSTSEPNLRVSSTSSINFKDLKSKPKQKKVTNLFWIFLIPCLIIVPVVIIMKFKSITSPIRDCFRYGPRESTTGSDSTSDRTSNGTKTKSESAKTGFLKLLKLAADKEEEGLTLQTTSYTGTSYPSFTWTTENQTTLPTESTSPQFTSTNSKTTTTTTQP